MTRPCHRVHSSSYNSILKDEIYNFHGYLYKVYKVFINHDCGFYIYIFECLL